MDYREANKISVEKAREIAAEMSNIIGCGPWVLNEKRTEDCNNGAFIVSGERELHIIVGGYRLKDRIEISGSYNGLTSYLPYHKDREKTEITVAGDRPIAAIAKEICRRLLPAYESMRAAAKASRDEDMKRRTKIMGILTELAEIIPGASVRDPDDLSREYPSSSRPWVTTHHNPYYDVRKIETYGDDVHIDIRVSPELAKKLFKAIEPEKGVTE